MDNLAESLLLLTKTNSKVVDKIKELDAKIDSVVIASTKTVTPLTVNSKQKTTQPATAVKADVADKTIVRTVEKPKTVIISDFTKEALNDLAGILGSKQVEAARVRTVEKPKTVIISDFTKEALNDLAGILGSKQVEAARPTTPPEKSKSGNKLLGWLAAAAGTYAIIKNFKLENIPGLITGLQSAKKRITKLKGAITKTFSKMKGAFKKIIPKGLQNSITKNINKFKTKSKALFSKVANKITSSIKNVGNKAAGLAKNLGSKALKAFTTSMSALGSKIKTVLNSAKTAVTKTISSAADGVDDIAKGMKSVPALKSTGASGSAPKSTGASRSAPKPKTSFFGKMSDKVSKASKSVVATASKAKGAGINLAKKAINVGFKAVGGVKKLAGALVKSPLLAPIVESVLAYKDINKSIEEYKTGEIDKKELDKRIGTRTIKGLGGIIGGAVGAGAGAAALGSFSFGLAAPIGAIIGGVGGDMAGRFIGRAVANAIGDKTDVLGKNIGDTKLFKSKIEKAPTSTPSEGKESLEASREVSAVEKPVEIEDGIITKAGKLIKPHKEDFLYAMKDGGPLANAMSGDNKATEKNNEILEQFKSLTKSLSIKQIELMEMNNKLLKSIQGSLDESPKSGNGTVVTSNNSNTTNVNFKSPGLRDIQLTYG